MQPPDLSKLTGHFVVDQVLAGAVLAAALLLILLGMQLLARRSASTVPGVSRHSLTGAVPGRLRAINTRRWHLLAGLDNRASTSRAVALMWTVVVGYCLLALSFIATSQHSAATPIPPGRLPDGWVNAAFQQLAPTYLVALGAPYAAALAARTIVGTRTANGTLQKSKADSASMLDLVTDDDGNLDLVDLQYTLFNVITAVFVLLQFIPHASRGIVDIPPALATLSGLSAALYTGNKLTGSNPPRLDQVLTPSVVAGGSVTAVGANLVVNLPGADPVAAASQTMITLSHTDSPSPPSFAANQVAADRLTFTVPDGTPAGAGWNLAVRTNAGGSAILFGAFDVKVGALPPARVPVPVNGVPLDGARRGGIGVPAGR